MPCASSSIARTSRVPDPADARPGCDDRGLEMPGPCWETIRGGMTAGSCRLFRPPRGLRASGSAFRAILPAPEPGWSYRPAERLGWDVGEAGRSEPDPPGPARRLAED